MFDRSGFRGWWIVGVAFATQAVSIGCSIGTFSLFIKSIVEEFGTSYAEVNAGIAIMTVLMTGAGPIVGPMLDRRSIRGVMLIGAGLCSSSLLLLSFSSELWQLGLLFGVSLAVGVAMLGPLASATVVAKWFESKRGRALGIANMGAPAGPFFFAPLAGWLIDAVGWRSTLQVYAGLSLLVMPLIVLVIRNQPSDLGQVPDGGTGSTAPMPPHQVSSDRPGPADAMGLVRDRNFWAIAVAIGIVFGVGGGWNAQIVPFASDLGIEARSAALAVGLTAGVAILGTFLFGTLADTVSHRGLLWSLIAAQIVAFAAFRTLPSPTVFYALLSFFALAAGGFLPVYASLVARTFGPASFGRVMGTAGLVMLPFGFAAPIVAGALRDAAGSYTSAFSVFIVSFAVSAAVLLLVRLPVGARRE